MQFLHLLKNYLQAKCQKKEKKPSKIKANFKNLWVPKNGKTVPVNNQRVRRQKQVTTEPVMYL